MTRTALGAVLALAAAVGCGTPPPAADDGWQLLEPGLELGLLDPPAGPSSRRGRIRVLRIDPTKFQLRLLMASAEDDERARTARGWAEHRGLVAAMNAGMYQEDFRTSVSLMRTRDHVNNRRLTAHRSVLAFDPLDSDVDPVRLIDLECEAFEDWRHRYDSFVQSIRMIACDGRNVWSSQPQRVSTAAIGIDDRGNVLMVHVRTPWTTHDLIEALKRLPLGVSRLMYVEGGPQAQLFARATDRTYEFVGTFDGADDESGGNQRAWPVPNVIGVTRLAPNRVTGP